MKKTIFILSALFIAALILSGCSNSNQNNTSSNQEINRRPDFGQPERTPDISGLVKSITGNQVTIIKLDRPGRASSTPEENTDNSNNQNEQQGNTMIFGGGAPRGGGAGGGFVYRGGGGGERPGGPRSADNSDSRAAMLERLKEMSSGEETVTIPVGIQMLKPETSNSNGTRQQPNMVEATLADITADKMIQVWLDESVPDRKIASFVLIMR